MSDQWHRIDRVWHAALALPDAERAAAVAELCAGDEALRRDVESLLASLTRASAAGFGAGTHADRARGSLIGRRLGPYLVHAWLGAGGMGEVYQAHDTALGREVALKVLPELGLADPDRRARFDREARLLASLDHPNIGALYDVHESDGIRALVLELVEGETLAERIARSPSRRLPIDDALAMAAQIVAAIEAAHARGVVHRDLTPANIKITPDDRVKVLDFGLARAVGAAGDGTEPADATAGTVIGTLDGVLLGTAAYMSPEQARGRRVDARADIWAFGCLLYEMLTGVQACGGDGLAETLANVIRREPNWAALPRGTPPGVRRCLRGCLEKDVQRRFHHIADARLAMEGVFENPADAGASTDRRGRPGGRAVTAGWTAAAILAVVALALTGLLLRPGPEPTTPRAEAPLVLLRPPVPGGGTGTAGTIQEAIDLVGRGGTVTVLPGTYAEALVITKGLTLEATGERSGEAILAPPGTAEAAIEVATTEPVVLRGLTVHVSGAHGIRGTGGVRVTIAQSTVRAVDPPTGRGALIQVMNDARATGARARVVVRDNVLDGAVPRLPGGVARPQSHAVQIEGDVDAVLERNTVRRTGGICIVVQTRRDDLGGETNADIFDNDIDECHPMSRVSAILVGSPSIRVMSPDQTITATGVVNIVGNTIRNSSEDCVINAIAFDVFSGRIERNRIAGFVQPCAMPTPRNLPAAIWIGLRGPDMPRVPAIAPLVRYNDVHGNFRAGLGVASNQAVPIDASCNYWGARQGPSGIGPGTGDAIVVEPGAAAPLFEPFATEPVARAVTAGC